MHAFYLEEHLAYARDTACRAVTGLLSDPGLGALFLLRDRASEAHGYLAATWGFSLEFGGRYALLDELYLRPSARGRGAGKSALSFLETWAASHHASAVRLEVNHHNEKALSVYLKSGFSDDQRRILSKRISRHAG